MDSGSADRKKLYELLDVVDRADRVEALPVTMIGEGLSSEPRVEEKPVPVDRRAGIRLARLLTGFDWTTASAMACPFTPHVAFRFDRGGRSSQVLVCFDCGEMILDGLDGPLGGRKLLGRGRQTWLRAAKQAFPNDPLLRHAK